MRWILIEKENSPAAGCANALFPTLALVGALAVLLLGCEQEAPAPAPEPEIETVTGQAEDLSSALRGDEEERCLILLPPEVSPEPDFVIGRGEECEK